MVFDGGSVSFVVFRYFSIKNKNIRILPQNMALRFAGLCQSLPPGPCGRELRSLPDLP